MIKNIKPEELINTEAFVREPVYSLTKEIRENSSKKIILNGGRGTGKSVTLSCMQNQGLGMESQTIFMHFDSVISFAEYPTKWFNEAFFAHYYELVFSWNLLSFIKQYYGLTYETYFQDIEALLHNVSQNTNDYIQNIYFSKRTIERFLRPTEISSEIITRLKKYLGIQKLNLAIDRFDWMNGSSSYTQSLISKYFDLFDKTVITVDDDSLEKERLIKNGYSFVPVTYGKEIDVIKQIIRRRINLNKVLNPFDVNILSDEIYKKMIEKLNGDISSMIVTCGEIHDVFTWEEGKVDINAEADEAILCQLIRKKELREIDGNPPKFYL